MFNGAWPYELPPTGHFNVFVTKAITLGIYRDLIEAAPALYHWADDKYVPVLAEKWGYEGGEHFTLTLKPGLKWSDGTPLTAKDALATFIARRMYSGQLFEYVDRVEARDERTIALHMKTPSTVVERYVLREPIVPYALYGQFTDKAVPVYAQGKDNSADEIKAIRKDFDQFRPDKWLASGPYMLDQRSMTEASAELVKNPQGVHADVVRFDRIKLYNGETPVVSPLILAKEIDYATHGLAVATTLQMKAQGIRILRTTTYGGQGVVINHANPKLKILTDKRVRQAFAHAVNREVNAAVTYAESGRVPKYMAGVQDGLLEKWLSKDDLAKLNQYPYDIQKATALMLAAGCKKQGDQWLDPDGRPMEYELVSEAEFQDRSASGQDWADQMGKFGVKVIVRAVSFTQTPIEKREGKFELAMDPWGTGNPHPHFSFVATLLSKVQPLANGPYTSFELKQKTDVVGEVDFQQLITASAQGIDVEAEGGDRQGRAGLQRIAAGAAADRAADEQPGPGGRAGDRLAAGQRPDLPELALHRQLHRLHDLQRHARPEVACERCARRDASLPKHHAARLAPRQGYAATARRGSPDVLAQPEPPGDVRAAGAGAPARPALRRSDARGVRVLARARPAAGAGDPGRLPARGAPNPQLLAEWEDGGLVRQKWLIDVQRHLSATLLVNRPVGLGPGRRPALLCWHGHGPFGKDVVMGDDGSPERRDNIARHNYDYGRQMARRGFVTFAIDWIGAGERNDGNKPNWRNSDRGRDWCNLYYLNATMLGMTSLSINVAHGRAATDFACTLPAVDPARLGVLGLSGGGRWPSGRRCATALPRGRDHLLQRPLGALRHPRPQLLRDAGRARPLQAGRSARSAGPAGAPPAAGRHRRLR